MKKFCTRPSRLFSGDPSALFCQDSDFFSQSEGPLTLASPFQFQMDTVQAADSQQWHIPLVMVSIFNPVNNLAINANLFKLMLMFNQLVGSTAQAADGTIQIQNAGIEIEESGGDLINATAGGWQSFFYRGPIEVPPRWFLRLAIFDDGSGTVLPADSVVTLRMQRQIIDAKFAEQS